MLFGVLSSKIGRRGGIRTRTGRILNPLSLPVGLRTHLLIWPLWFDLGTYYVPLGFDPDFCATRQRFIGRINKLAWRGDCQFMTIIVRLVGFDRDYRLTLPCFGVAANFMLIYMNPLFHLFLSFGGISHSATILPTPNRSGIMEASVHRSSVFSNQANPV